MKTYANLSAVVVLAVVMLAGVANAEILSLSSELSHWPFEAGSGDTAFDVAGVEDGAITGAAWSTDTPGPLGRYSTRSLSFDGTDDFINAGLGDLWRTDGEPVSIAAWIKTASVASAAHVAGFWSQHHANYALWVESDGYTDFVAGNQPRMRDNEVLVVDGEWHHLVGVSDGTGNHALYVDGVEVETATGTRTAFDGGGGGARFSIGAQFQLSPTASGRFFEGNIDDVRVYTHMLTPEEVLAIYIPEPGALTLLGLGSLALLRRRCRA